MWSWGWKSNYTSTRKVCEYHENMLKHIKGWGKGKRDRQAHSTEKYEFEGYERRCAVVELNDWMIESLQNAQEVEGWMLGAINSNFNPFMWNLISFSFIVHFLDAGIFQFQVSHLLYCSGNEVEKFQFR